MFKKILIANRGEIALRVIRSCRKMGIATVAVYSEADIDSMHIHEADEAVAIGGYTPRESYLVMEKILKAAKETGAEAIHPGYGFLSENAEFAGKVAEEGLVFIGPDPHAIRLLGDKTAARELAIRCNVPIAPGSEGEVSEFSDVERIANEIGFPVLLKAAAGGGGKGMRVVHGADELEAAYKGATGEALAAFGDSRVFIEKFIVEPRHIEIQILGDKHGTVLYFPERECSIQRRHQKVIEESPSMAVTPDIRKAMGEAGARLVAEAGYTNAGTIEFLLDASGKFYFMEVNTRLQVEHPVTEMVTGVDFVEQQIRIAAGLKLEISQDEIVPKGHAIECRICAEDVYNGFLPDTGVISYLSLPEGKNIRNDSALKPGYEVTVHYDPMVAKLIVWGEDRDRAIDATLDALRDYHLSGFKTTIPFCEQILASEDFRTGRFSTQYVSNVWRDKAPQEVFSLLSGVAAFVRHEHDERRKPVFIANETLFH